MKAVYLFAVLLLVFVTPVIVLILAGLAPGWCFPDV